MRMHSIALLTSILILFTSLYCHGYQLPRRDFMRMDYHAGSQNWDISQSADGRMLFANNDGLLVFDGAQWNIYPVPNHSKVRCVFFDSISDRIYVGAYDEIGYFKSESGSGAVRFHSLVKLLPEGNRNFEEAWSVEKVGSNIVFQSRGGLMVYSPKKEEVKPIPANSTITASALVDGLLYVACSDGIYVLKNDALVPLPGTSELHGKRIKTIAREPLGNGVVFATIDSGLFLYDGSKTELYLPQLLHFLTENLVYCTDVQDNKLAIGTIHGGAVVADVRSGKIFHETTGNGLPDNTVFSTRFDRSGNLWLGLANGISCVMKDLPYRKIFPEGNGKSTAYASALSGNTLYLGTNKGLFAMTYPSFDSVSPVAGMNRHVWSICPTSAGVLVGAHDGAYFVSAGGLMKIPVKTTWDIRRMPGKGETYILATESGFHIIDMSGGSPSEPVKITGLDPVTGNFEIDTDGSIWTSDRSRGIVHAYLDPLHNKVIGKEFFGRKNGLPSDADNTVSLVGKRIYISTTNGLYLYDRAKHMPVAVRIPGTMSGRHSSIGLRLVEAPGNRIWAVAPGTASLIGKGKNGVWTADSISFGAIAHDLHTDFGRFISLGNADGRSIFNGNEGFYLVNAGSRPAPGPRGIIVNAVRNTATDSLLYSDSFGKHTSGVLMIPHDMNSLTFEFVLPEYRTAGAVEYSCMLEGYEKEWTALGTDPRKEYTRLDKGEYTFRIKAFNKLDGLTSERSFSFVILPAWYETWWAITLYIIMAVVGLFFIVRYAERRIKRKQEMEYERLREEKEEEMLRRQEAFDRENERKERELIALRNRQLEFDLRHKAGELADSTMNLVRKNDILQELDKNIKELADGIRNDEPGKQLALQADAIRRSIKQNLSDDDNWDKFRSYFDLVYDNFIEKLKARYPDLKMADIKLCAYLKMGLSSKEISSLLNTAVRSVENSRYRLRKKLGLQPEDNLTEFLQNLDSH